MGCSVSHTQADILSTFKGRIIVGYDNDSAGQEGLDRFENLRKEKRMGHIYTCNPPQGCKDWNDALVRGVNVSEYLQQQTSLYDFDYKVLSEL
jgi:DNA primase